jgi:hypothetical protein
MLNFFLPNFKFFCPILSSYQKVMAFLPNHLRVRVSMVWYRLEWEIEWSNDDENFTVMVRRGCGKERKAQKISFATYLGLVTRRINTRWLVRQTDKCSGSVCCWIGGISWADNQMHGAEYYKPKTRIQTNNNTQPRWTQTQQSNWKMKIAALRAIG